MAVDEKGNFFAAVNGQYSNTQYNRSLEKKRLVTRKDLPGPMTEAEVAVMAEPIYKMAMRAMPPQISEVIPPNVVRRALKKPTRRWSNRRLMGCWP